jgi:hypothetical protein
MMRNHKDLQYNTPVPSTRKGKRYMVKVLSKEGKDLVIHFGDSRYADFTMTGDLEARRRYIARTIDNVDSNGNLTRDDPCSANFWTLRICWKYEGEEDIKLLQSNNTTRRSIDIKQLVSQAAKSVKSTKRGLNQA